MQARPPRKHSSSGMTIIELVVTMALAGILAVGIGYLINWMTKDTKTTTTSLAKDAKYTELCQAILNPVAIATSAIQQTTFFDYSSGNFMLHHCATGNKETFCTERLTQLMKWEYPDASEGAAGFRSYTIPQTEENAGYYMFTLYSPAKSLSGTADLIPKPIAGVSPENGRPIRYTRDGLICGNEMNDDFCPIWAQAFFKPICEEDVTPCHRALAFLVRVVLTTSPKAFDLNPALSSNIALITELQATVEVSQAQVAAGLSMLPAPDPSTASSFGKNRPAPPPVIPQAKQPEATFAPEPTHHYTFVLPKTHSESAATITRIIPISSAPAAPSPTPAPSLVPTPTPSPPKTADPCEKADCQIWADCSSIEEGMKTGPCPKEIPKICFTGKCMRDSDTLFHCESRAVSPSGACGQ